MREERLNWFSVRSDWLDIILSGASPIDRLGRVESLSLAQADAAIVGYGYHAADPIEMAELYGYFREALQFISQTLQVPVPGPIHEITDVRHLLIMGSQVKDQVPAPLQKFACATLKIIHVIAHIDRDLRNYYFNRIRDDIYGRFRNSVSDKAFVLPDGNRLPLVDFQLKEQKSRPSLILKLLFKPEVASEEVYDRLGVRYVVPQAVEVFPLIRGMIQSGLINVANLRPKRSRNFLVDVAEYQARILEFSNRVRERSLSEEDFLQELSQHIRRNLNTKEDRLNQFSSNEYQAIQFTSRQLVRVENSAFSKLQRIRNLVREEGGSPRLTDEVQSMDLAEIPRELKFFYPVEVQIMDEMAYQSALHGEASHQQYKQQQTDAVRRRLFGEGE